MKNNKETTARQESHSKKMVLIMAVADWALIVAVLLLSRGLLPGAFPRWYWLVGTAAVWALIGAASHKLDFWYFDSAHRACLTILIVDVVVYMCSFVVWKLLLPDRGIQAAQLWPLPVVIIIEWILCRSWYTLFHKVPYLYVDIIEPPLIERGIENATKYLDSKQQCRDLTLIFQNTDGLTPQESNRWILQHMDLFDSSTLIVTNADDLPDRQHSYRLVFCLEPFNRIRHLNTFLMRANQLLVQGGMLGIYGESSSIRKHRILQSYPKVIGQIVFVADYLWSRVMSKLSITRSLYMKLSDGRNRNLPRVEVLGRVAKAGFEICGDELREKSFIVTAVRQRDAITTRPRYGLIVRLPRQGKDGKEIGVFKLRTMYAYSEYIQDYTYRLNGLERGGKLKNDFRVNFVGRYCRSLFLDELPMLFNFLRGDLKLVGVRPLSKHYLSLYTPRMQQLHLSVKPGIFPPLYYEYPKPDTLQQIQDSEERYILRYLEHPFLTDWKYFWGMMRNILLRRERSH